LTFHLIVMQRGPSHSLSLVLSLGSMLSPIDFCLTFNMQQGGPGCFPPIPYCIVWYGMGKWIETWNSQPDFYNFDIYGSYYSIHFHDISVTLRTFFMRTVFNKAFGINSINQRNALIFYLFTMSNSDQGNYRLK